MAGKLGALIAAGGLALALAGAVSASPQLDHPGTIRITDRAIQRAGVDLGPKGHSAGDVETVRQLLYNQSYTTKPIGHTELICTYIDRASRNCSGTYFMPQGRIMVGGVIGTRLIFALAVLGGTGIYDNVRGTLTVTSLSVKPSREILVFRLVV
jgi:hypothetical protein